MLDWLRRLFGIPPGVPRVATDTSPRKMYSSCDMKPSPEIKSCRSASHSWSMIACDGLILIAMVHRRLPHAVAVKMI